MSSAPVIVVRPQLTLILPALLMGVLALACTDDGETPGRSFYAEIAVDVDASSADSLDGFRAGEGRGGAIRWWYASDPVRWRWEIETTGTIIDDGVLVTVFDGTDSWAHDDRVNTYQRSIIPEALTTMALSPIFSAPVGPANADTIDGFIERWREWDDVAEVSLAGESTILGRQTQIVELRLASGGTIRAFVDPERMFIMRWSADGGSEGQAFDARVTVLDYDTNIDAGLLMFSPPPGTREAGAVDGGSCGSSSISFAQESAFPIVAGFLRPSYAPQGYRSAGAGSEEVPPPGCGPTAVSARIESSGGAYVLLRQRQRHGGIPATVRSWEAVDSNLDDAYRHSENGLVWLVWRDGAVVALLESNSVPLAELLRIAESSELIP